MSEDGRPIHVEDYRDKFLILNFWATADAYQKFLRAAGVRFPTVRDTERQVSRLYGTLKVPETYFIDRRGKIVQKIVNQANWDDPEILSREQLLRG